jgi:hypothetical protein
MRGTRERACDRHKRLLVIGRAADAGATHRLADFMSRTQARDLRDQTGRVTRRAWSGFQDPGGGAKMQVRCGVISGPGCLGPGHWHRQNDLSSDGSNSA